MNNQQIRAGLPRQTQSIQARLLVSLSGTLLITLLIVVVSIYVLSTNLERTSWQERQASVTAIAGQEIRSFIDQNQRILMLLASSNDEAHAADQIVQVLNAAPAFLELILTDSQGQVLAQATRIETGEFNRDPISQSVWYTQAINADEAVFYFEEIQFSTQGLPYLVISTKGANGGVAAGSIDMSFVNHILDAIRFDESGSAYIAEAEGRIIAHTDPSIALAGTSLAGRTEFPIVDDAEFAAPLLTVETVAIPQTRSYDNFQGVSVIGTVKNIPGTDWLLFSEISQQEATATSQSLGLPLIVFAALFWGGAMFSATWIIRNRIFIPLSRIRQGQEALADGDLNHQVLISHPDELGIVTAGFNQMVVDLRQRTQEQKHAEVALRESEKRYRELVENVSDIVFTINLKGLFTYVSPSAAALTGYTEAQLLGMHFTELIDPNWQETVAEFYIQQMKSVDRETTLVFPIISPSQHTRWVEQKVIPIYNDHDEMIGFEGVVRDITERKESEEKLRALYAVMAQPSLTIDDQLTQAVQIGAAILGFEVGVISHIEHETFSVLYAFSDKGDLEIGQTFNLRELYCELAFQANDIIAIEDAAKSQYKSHPCYEHRKVSSFLGVALEVNGLRYGTLSFSSISPHGRPFSTADQDFCSLMGRWVSVMLEQKLALEELRESEANMRSLLDNSPAIITKVDKGLRVEFVRVPGVDPALLESYVGQSFLNFMPEQYHATAQTALQQMFSERRDVQYETTAIDPRDGMEHWYSTNAAPIIEGDTLASALLISSDITERKRAERQIQAQNEALVKTNRELAVSRKQAEAASKLKSQFLATMSHELRTPLNAVIGYAQLQLAGMAGDMTAEQTEFQERILVNAQHLLQLINEVLDLSKIEAGRMELAERPFDLRECLDEVVLQNVVLAEKKALAFALNVDDRLPEIIVGDRGRVKQVIINLVSNAIKFTDQGSVTIDVVLYNKESWRLTVTDTGVGIAPHLQETIFDEFRQAENGIERGGTGLGLAIVRKLVLMMGGNIRLNSEVGQGSAFIVTLPLITEVEASSEAVEA
jgi:PAS domain S-box-containing protein